MDNSLENRLRIKSDYRNDEKKYLLYSTTPERPQEHIRNSFFGVNKTLGLLAINLDKDWAEAKRRFSYHSQVAEYLNNVYQDAWMTYSLSVFTYAFCSDNLPMIERLGNNLKLSHVAELAKNDGGCKMLAMPALIRRDWDELEGYLSVLGRFAQKAKPSPYTIAIKAILEGFRDEDADKIRINVQALESKRLKSHRIKNGASDEEYISIWALGFTKLAWLRGMEIKIDSDYVPKELLPFEPLEEYTIPYWFLRDYYKEQGVDWRYDPIHPELQP